MSNSYRKILHSSSVIGFASVINIVIKVIRMKAVAILLGPAGVGLIGLFNNLTSVATAVSGMGIANSGVREIADAAGRNDELVVAKARRILFLTTIVLAVLGSSIFWLLRHYLATNVLHNSSLASQVGWLSIAVGLTIASASQNALLNGLRRIGDMSRISVFSGILSTILGVAAIVIWGESAIVLFILLTPISIFILGHMYVSRIPKVTVSHMSILEMKEKLSSIFRLGFAFMLSGFIILFGQLLVRSIIQDKLGLDATGYFQASWAISMTYIGFVLAAMGMDYYPRLTAVINDHKLVNKMVNEQTEVSLYLAGPVILAMLALSPWVIAILYTSDFHPAVVVLQWQILGDILKIACWPLAFIMLAAGDGKKYVWSESLGIGVLVLLTFILIPLIGLKGSGISFLGMYLFILPMQRILAGNRTGFKWEHGVSMQIISLFVGGGSIIAVSYFSEIASVIYGLILTILFAILGFNKLAKKAEVDGPVRALMSKVNKFINKFTGAGRE